MKALLRNEPILLDHAKAFVQAINKLLEAKGHPQDRLENDDSVEGAFFIVDGFAHALAERKISPADLASTTRHPEKLVEAATQGYRLTLSSALDLIRGINSLAPSAAEPLNPLTALLTDYRKGRKAAANGCVAYRNRYVKWPPETLLSEDAVQNFNSGNVTKLRS